jgi:hypothetical protein
VDVRPSEVSPNRAIFILRRTEGVKENWIRGKQYGQERGRRLKQCKEFGTKWINYEEE